MNMTQWIPSVLSRIPRAFAGPRSTKILRLRREIQEAKIVAARTLIHQLRRQGPLARLADAEFKVFSQFGDDGIIQYLIHHLDVQPRVFVEFGVENYLEANTRFLLINDNWQGLVMDGSPSNIRYVQGDEIYWRHDLTAVQAFIDRDNIRDLLESNGCGGDLGILSVDIDGNDYWVWERLDNVEPTIVIAEYNALFGPHRAVSIPYDPAFVRSRAHHSNLYWGCSLKALCVLAQRKGLELVGCNSNGNNAYFVHRDRLNGLRPLSSEAGYVEARFRESRDRGGELSYLRGFDRLDAIREMPLVDVVTNQKIQVGDLYVGEAYRAA